MWAGASSRVVARALALALALLAACNEPLGPPKEKSASGSQATSQNRVGSDPIAPPADAAVPVVVIIDAPPVAMAIDAASEEPPDAPLYRVVDALADAKASPLKRIGIGEWPGNFSIKGCIYRNDRVFVVDVYCTYKEQTAFSTVIISPDKGEVRIYAEADDPISTIERAKYFSFYAESYPLLDELPTPALKDATFEQVTEWQEQLYNARLKRSGMTACSTGMRSCDQDPAWQDAAAEFIAEPTEDWSWIIDQLRNRAQNSGKYVVKKQGTPK